MCRNSWPWLPPEGRDLLMKPAARIDLSRMEEGQGAQTSLLPPPSSLSTVSLGGHHCLFVFIPPSPPSLFPSLSRPRCVHSSTLQHRPSKPGHPQPLNKQHKLSLDLELVSRRQGLALAWDPLLYHCRVPRAARQVEQLFSKQTLAPPPPWALADIYHSGLWLAARRLLPPSLLIAPGQPGASAACHRGHGTRTSQHRRKCQGGRPRFPHTSQG